MTRIKGVGCSGLDVAGYFYNDDTIYYDKNLDSFPELKKKILAHELYHAKHRKDFKWHYWIDLKDVVVFARTDFIQYRYFGKLPEDVRLRDVVLYNVFNFFRSILQFPFILAGFMAFIVKMLIGDKDED